MPKARAQVAGGVAQKVEQLQGEVSRQKERFAAVLEIGALLSQARDLDQLLGLVLDRLATLLEADAATLFMHDAASDELWSRVLKGSTLKEIRIPADRGIAGHVLRLGEAVRVGDAYQDPRFNPEVDRKSGFRTRSILAVPLRHVSGRVLGVLQVLHRKQDAFSPEDLRLVEAVAAQVAGVLDNVLLVEELRRQNEALRRAQSELSWAVGELDVLFELERAISAPGDQTDLLDRILVKALSVTSATAGSILLCDEEQGTMYFRSARGEHSEVLTSLRLEPGQGVAGRVALTGKVVRLLDAEQSPHYDPTVARQLGVTVRELICVPIPGQRGRLGALELLNKAGGFSDPDERMAVLLAGQAGRALLQRRSREEGERKARLAAIGQMLSGVLHDLRTPLTVIGGYIQLLGAGASEEERAEFVQVIEKQLEHIGTMTRETLAFARGERELLIRKVYLQNFVAEVEQFLRKELEGTGVELRMQAHYLGAARFDEGKVKRLVSNIARNAVEAMSGRGGRFTLQVQKEEGQLVLRFSDDGPGVPEEISDRLFEEFVTSGKKDGTGLGLAIVKKIVEEHRGTVSCQSRPGGGTTFEVRLPQKD